MFEAVLSDQIIGEISYANKEVVFFKVFIDGSNISVCEGHSPLF